MNATNKRKPPVPGPVRPLDAMPPGSSVEDLEVEELVLTEVLSGTDPRGLGLAPSDFYGPANRLVMEAALALVARGEAVGHVEVSGELRARGALAPGEADRIARLAVGAGSMNLGTCVRRVRDRAARRATLARLDAASRALYDPRTPTDEVLATMREASAPMASVLEVPTSPVQGEGLPGFPVHVLPEWFRVTVEDFAAGVDAPVEMTVVPALAVAGAALGPGWVVGTSGLNRGPCVWLGLVAPSGMGKTPGGVPCFEPVWKADVRLREEHELEETERQRAAGKKKVQPRPRKRAIVTDTTPEALMATLAANEGRGLVWSSDELATLLGSLDRYNQSRCGRSSLLSLWSGVGIRSPRKTADTAEVDSPFLTTFGGVQPAILAKLSLEDGDGMCARFLWSHVKPRMKTLGDGPSDGARERWGRAIALAFTVGHGPRQAFVEEGRALLKAYVEEMSAESNDADAAGVGLISSVKAKAPDQAVRLAAILHGLEVLGEAMEDDAAPRRRPVSVETVGKAIELARYFVIHGAYTARVAVGKADVDGDAKNGKDADLEDVLMDIVRPGESVEDTPAGWAGRLTAAGMKVSPTQVGKRLGRIENLGAEGITVTRDRDRRRSWVVARSA